MAIWKELINKWLSGYDYEDDDNNNDATDKMIIVFSSRFHCILSLYYIYTDTHNTTHFLYVPSSLFTFPIILFLNLLYACNAFLLKIHENEKKWPAGQAVLAGGWLKLFMTHLTLSFSLSLLLLLDKGQQQYCILRNILIVLCLPVNTTYLLTFYFTHRIYLNGYKMKIVKFKLLLLHCQFI